MKSLLKYLFVTNKAIKYGGSLTAAAFALYYSVSIISTPVDNFDEGEGYRKIASTKSKSSSANWADEEIYDDNLVQGEDGQWYEVEEDGSKELVSDSDSEKLATTKTFAGRSSNYSDASADRSRQPDLPPERPTYDPPELCNLSCPKGQTLNEPACICEDDPDDPDPDPETKSCDIANGTGFQSRSWTDGAWDDWGVCTVSSCDDGYNIEANACVLNDDDDPDPETRSCDIANGTGSQSRSWTDGAWGDWGTCTAVSCDSGYRLSAGTCVPDDIVNPPPPTCADIVTVPVSLAGNTGENGTNEIFDVVTTESAGDDVVITFTTSDGSEATAPVAMTFTDANFDTIQVATVAGVDDPLYDGDKTFEIRFSVASANPDFVFTEEECPVIGGTNIDDDIMPMSKVAVGGSHSCAIMADSSLKCFGSNSSGQLGINTTVDMGGSAASMGVNLSAALAAGNANDVKVGGKHTCSVSAAGAMKCFGGNSDGQLGQGDFADEINASVVADISFVGAATVSKFALGKYHTCIISSDDNVQCFGDNSHGQLGQDSTADATSPVIVTLADTPVEITAGDYHTCVLFDNNDVRCFGKNVYGQLGISDHDNIGDGIGTDTMAAITNSDLSDLGTISGLTAGANHTCAWDSTGAFMCWGRNASGQLGIGSTIDQGLALTPMSGLGALVFGSSVSSMSAGGDNTCAVLADNQMKCFGDNYFGQLGLGDAVAKGDDAGELGILANVSFSQLPTNMVTTIISADVGVRHMCALLSSGEVKCYGYGNVGELGNQSVRSRGIYSDELNGALENSELIDMIPTGLSVPFGGNSTTVTPTIYWDSTAYSYDQMLIAEDRDCSSVTWTAIAASNAAGTVAPNVIVSGGDETKYISMMLQDSVSGEQSYCYVMPYILATAVASGTMTGPTATRDLENTFYMSYTSAKEMQVYALAGCGAGGLGLENVSSLKDVTFTAVDGVKTYSVEYSSDGGDSGCTDVNVTLDQAAPDCAFISVPAVLGINASENITFSCDDDTPTLGSGIALYLCKATGTGVGAGNWVACDSAVDHQMETMSTGTYKFYMKAVDNVGNVSTAISSTWTVDFVDPTITSVTTATATGFYTIGEEILITINFSENIVPSLASSTTLLLETGATDRTAVWDSTGASSIVYKYTVQAGDATLDLNYGTPATALALNLTTIKDAAGNNADLTLPAFLTAEALDGQQDIEIDTSTPTVTSVAAVNIDATYTIGANIDIEVTFSESVDVNTVGGTPTLLLETGVTDRTASYTGGTGTAILTFRYTVQVDDDSADLSYFATNSLVLNGGTIADHVNNATLTLPALAGAGSLDFNSGIVIDTNVAYPTNVTATGTANGIYTVDEVIDVEVTFSEVVDVTGTPQMTMETGTTDRVINYTGGSGGSVLTFRYTVLAGDTSVGLDYTVAAVIVLGGTIVTNSNGLPAALALPAAGAANSLGDNKAIVIDTTSSVITAVSSGIADGSYKAGDVIAITVTFNEVMDVIGGTPILTLETGATTTSQPVNYSSGTASNTLTFNYTVQAGDTSADLQYLATTALALGGGFIRDAAGNNADLTLPIFVSANSLAGNKALVIDTAVPTVTNVTSNLAAGTYTTGQVVDVRVTFSESVDVALGTPRILMDNGAAGVYGTYISGSGTTELLFNYTVLAGDVNTDLDYNALDSLELNGATILDTALNAADRTLVTPGNPTSLADNEAIVIDTIAATVNFVSSTTPNGTYAQPTLIPVTIEFSEVVYVTGSPYIVIDTGATTTSYNATYASGDGTNTLTFNYTVQVDDDSADLNYLATNSLVLNAGTIKDFATNNVALTLPALAGADSLFGRKDIVINTNVASVTAVSSTEVNGNYTTAATLDITVTFSEAVDVTGSPQLLLETGATDRQAIYTGGTGTATLTFEYTVVAGDISLDLDYVATGSLTLNGGTIKNAATTDAVLTLAAPAAAGSLGNNKALVISTDSPTVTNVTSAKANATYTAPEVIDITVTFSEPVDVGGAPYLVINTGATTTSYNAPYLSGTGSATITFRYTVQANDNSTDLDYAAVGSLVLNAGTIDSVVNNAATLTLVAPGAAGSLGNNKAIIIDGVSPAVTGVASNLAAGTYTTGQVIDIRVTFSENVNVAVATPRILIANGAAGVYANYVSGTGSTELLFNYTVLAGDTHADLDYNATNALEFNGATIKDAIGNNADLTLPALAAAGSLSDNEAIVIDTTAATVNFVSSTTANGTYAQPTLIPVTIEFNEVVYVTGSPYIVIDTGATTTSYNATYASGDGTNTLTFNYTVQVDDDSADLNYLATNSLVLNGGTIKDFATNNVTLTLPALAGADSLFGRKDIVINTNVASVTGVSSTETNGNFTTAATLDITVTFSEAVWVTGFPQLLLETGATDRQAIYTGGSGTATLTFEYTVVAGDISLDLDYVATGSLSLGGGTIKNAATTNAVLTLVAPAAAESLGNNKALVISTDSPTVTNVTSAKADATYTAPEVIDITVTFSEPVDVGGAPYLIIDTGATTTSYNAPYVSGTGSDTITFRYTVQTGDVSGDLDYDSSNAITLNGGTIDSVVNNAATLTMAIPGAAGSLGANKIILIDAVPATVTNVISTVPGDGGYTTGQLVAITVTFDKIVNVTGTPQILLETGTTDRYANYFAGSGSTTWTFNYTVVAGDLTADLNYMATTSLGLNGGAIKDAMLNDATLTLPGLAAAGSLGTNNDIIINAIVATVNGVSSAKVNSVYTIGEVIDIDVTFSENVTVADATPYLVIDTGATTTSYNAPLQSGSGTSVLTFRYTVQANDDSADLDYLATTSLNLNGATIKNSGTTNADVTLVAPAAIGSLGNNKDLVINTATASVIEVGNNGATTANGSYDEGSVITITLKYDETVDVNTGGGTPTVLLETGATDRTASYTGGTGTDTLTFQYTVQSGDTSSDLEYANAATSLQLNGGVIENAVDIAAATALPAITGGDSLSDYRTLIIDTTDPVVTEVGNNVATTANGTYMNPTVITVTVKFNEVVTVATSNPTLLLETGTTDRTATYNGTGSGTDTLQFNYTIQAGDNSTDLEYVSAATSFQLAGSTIRDAAGNDVSMTLPTIGGTTSLSDYRDIIIDTTGPTITDVGSEAGNTANGSYDEGSTISISVKYDEAVTVTGSPTLLLEMGATDRNATYVSGSATDTLIFTYTPVVTGDNNSDLEYVNAGTSLQLAGGTMKDAIGNNASMTLPAIGGTKSLSDYKDIIIDTTDPTIDYVASSTGNGTYANPTVIAVTVLFDEVVYVNTGGGTPSIQLETGATDRMATYAAGTGTNTLTFNYTIVANDASADLEYLSTGAFALNSGTIKDLAGNDVNTTLPAVGVDSLSGRAAIVINTNVASVVSVSSTETNGNFTTAATLDITIEYSEAVDVTGNPTLTLETGSINRDAVYSSGSGGTTLTFVYTVVSGDISTDLDYVNTSSLALSGGTIKNAALTDASLGLPSPGGVNSLGNNKALVISTESPIVTDLDSITADGTYSSGKYIEIQVMFSEPVDVTGTPYLLLETGTTTTSYNAEYLSGSGTDMLIFTYTSQVDDESSDLRYVATDSLYLGGGTIDSVVNNAATLTLAPPGTPGSFGANKDIVINASVPAVTNVTSVTANGAYNDADADIIVTVTFDEIVTVTGTPQLAIDTATINYNGTGSGTNTLSFTYVIGAAHNDADLNYTSTAALALNGGTISDGTNNAVLTLPALAAAGSLGTNKNIVIDTTDPQAIADLATVWNSVAYERNLTFTAADNVGGSGLASTQCRTKQGVAAWSGFGACVSTDTFTVTQGEAWQYEVQLTDLAGNVYTSGTLTQTYLYTAEHTAFECTNDDGGTVVLAVGDTVCKFVSGVEATCGATIDTQRNSVSTYGARLCNFAAPTCQTSCTTGTLAWANNVTAPNCAYEVKNQTGWNWTSYGFSEGGAGTATLYDQDSGHIQAVAPNTFYNSVACPGSPYDTEVPAQGIGCVDVANGVNVCHQTSCAVACDATADATCTARRSEIGCY